jgi:hypothetical protein
VSKQRKEELERVARMLAEALARDDHPTYAQLREAALSAYRQWRKPARKEQS